MEQFPSYLMIATVVSVLSAFLTNSTSADSLPATPTGEGDLPASTILGPGIAIVGMPVYKGATAAAGTFTGGVDAGIGIESGIILSTGAVLDALGPHQNEADEANSTDDTTTYNRRAGDSLLSKLAGKFTFDASVLSIDFVTNTGDLYMNLVFASEVYDEFVTVGYNDVFIFLLDETNIAMVPDTDQPVAIDSINLTTNPTHFVGNTYDGAIHDIEYDGFTRVLTAQALDIGPDQQTIKLAIADAGDPHLDSAVFVEAGTFSGQISNIIIPAPSTALVLSAFADLFGMRPHWPADDADCRRPNA